MCSLPIAATRINTAWWGGLIPDAFNAELELIVTAGAVLVNFSIHNLVELRLALFKAAALPSSGGMAPAIAQAT